MLSKPPPVNDCVAKLSKLDLPLIAPCPNVPGVNMPPVLNIGMLPEFIASINLGPNF